MRFTRPKLLDVLLLCIYKLLLDVIFWTLVYPTYSYDPYYMLHGEPSLLKCVAGYPLAVLCLVIFGFVRSDAVITKFVTFIQIVLVTIPFITLYGYLNLPGWNVALMIFGLACVVLAGSVIPAPNFPSPRGWLRVLVVSCVVAIVVYVYLGLMATGGIGRLNFDFSKVYDYRVDYMASLLPGFGYFVNWTAYIFDMAWMILAIQSRSKSKILLIVALQFFLFGMTSFKSFLFAPIAMLGLVFLSGRMDLRRAIIVGLVLLIAMLATLSAFGNPFGAALLTRMIFVPAALHWLYFEYFSTHAFALGGDSLVGAILGSPYNESYVHVVSREYWGRVFSPNVGWIGDAFANFGLIGVILAAAALGLLLRIADGLAKGVTRRGLAEGLMVGPALALSSSALLTVMATHGLIVALIMLWVLKSFWSDGQGSRENDQFIR